MLGDGWYGGSTASAAAGATSTATARAAGPARDQLRRRRSQRVGTDDAGARRGPHPGQRHLRWRDLRRAPERRGWSSPSSTTANGTARTARTRTRRACRPAGPPVRRIEEVAPVAITTSPTGRTIVDFGQNLVGRVRFACAGRPDTTITLRHAEVLEDGELCIRTLRNARATDRYTLRGGDVGDVGAALHLPRLPLRARSTAGPASSSAEDIRAVVCHSDLERTGWFECSDAVINRLHENVVWGMRGNFLDVPTDCPQRDERLGWTGDIQVFAPTACFLYDVAGFLASWLADLAAEQRRRRRRAVRRARRRERRSAAGRGVGRCRRHRAVGAVPALRRLEPSLERAVRRACAAWVDQLAERAGPDRLVEQRLPVRRLARPERAAGQAGRRDDRPASSSPRAYFARSADLAGAAASARPRPDEPHATRARRRGARGLQPTSTSRRTGACSATPRPPTRSRSSSAVPDSEPARACR